MRIPASGSVLVDTNVLVYAYDRSEPVKRERAREVMLMLGETRRGVVSTQVLTEFVAVTTRGKDPLLDEGFAIEQARALAGAWPVLPVLRETVLQALDCRQVHQVQLWDAVLWATARRALVDTVVSEDFQDGRCLDGVCFFDPFAADFDLAKLEGGA